MVDGEHEREVESSLSAVYPYVGVDISEQLNAWAMAGFGSGEFTLKNDPYTTIDISMRMAAGGVRGELLSPGDGGGFGLAVKSDAMWVQVDSDAPQRVETHGYCAASGCGAKIPGVRERWKAQHLA